jgi:hypothetical protein
MKRARWRAPVPRADSSSSQGICVLYRRDPFHFLKSQDVTGVIIVTIGRRFQVQAQDIVRVCVRAERESQERQNRYSHHLGVQAER